MPFDVPRIHLWHERCGVVASRGPYLAAMVLAGVAVGVLAGWFARAATAVDMRVPTIALYQRWQLFCPAAGDTSHHCEYSQDILDPKSGALGGRLVAAPDNQVGMAVQISVANNILLEPGIAVAFGPNTSRVYPYATCSPSNCYAVVPIADFTSAARKARVGRIAYLSLDGKPATFDFSWLGFSDATEAYRRAEGRRRSWWGEPW